MRKANIYFPAIIISGFILASCNAVPKTDQAEKPNIIIIYADDLGYGDLSSYGGDIPTPNIDRIGAEGIRFTDFYVSAPACTPSRFSLLTGAYPQRARHDLSGALMPASPGYLDTSEKILPAYLKTLGYKTAIMGKWHLGFPDTAGTPVMHGFDEFSGFKGGCIDFFNHVYGPLGHDWYVKGQPVRDTGYSTNLLTSYAIDFIESGRDEPEPFFLYLSYNAPHYGKTDPNDIPENTLSLKEATYRGTNVINSLQAPASYVERFRHISDPSRRMYAAMVSCMDDNIGTLLEKLEEEQLLENTMIWFISDNGGYSESYFGHADNGGLRGEKATLWEGGIRVPALLRWEGQVPPGQVASSPVCNVDILPTLAAILGFDKELPENFVDGKDISAVLFNSAGDTGAESARAERTGTENESPESPLAAGEEPRVLFWKYRNQTAIRKGDWKLVNGKKLYNLASDRNERRNLALEYPEVVRQLQAHFKETAQTFE